MEKKNPPSETKFKTGKDHGSFWVDRSILDSLIRNKTSYLELASFLVLSRFTDESNCFSTAGIKSIKRSLGINEKMARQALRSLLSRQMRDMGGPVSERETYENVHVADEQVEDFKPVPARNAGIKAEVKFVINNFASGDEDRIWFHNDIVGDRKVGKYPLTFLNRLENPDIALRLLMYLHKLHDPDFDWASPFRGTFHSFAPDRERVFHSYRFFRGRMSKEASSSVFLAREVLGIDAIPPEEEKRSAIRKTISEHLEILVRNGFLQRVAGVLSGERIYENTIPLYDLDEKSSPLKSVSPQDRLSARIEPFARMAGLPAARGEKTLRFYDIYTGLLPEGEKGFLTGYYRPIFTVKNRKNAPVPDAHEKRRNARLEVLKWLEELNEIAPEFKIIRNRRIS